MITKPDDPTGGFNVAIQIPFSRGQRTTALAAIMAVSLVGCGSAPKPEAQLSAAETALHGAQGKDAGKYAPVPMDRAKQKLAKAQEAMQREQYDSARRFASEAQADAELAQAMADQAQADRAVRELESSIEALRNEIDRAANR
jgi:hypothetical protein